MASKKPSRARMTVTLARMSQDVQDIQVARGATLRNTLIAAGYADGDLEDLLEGLRVNGREVSLSTKLKAEDFITLSPRVQGGR